MGDQGGASRDVREDIYAAPHYHIDNPTLYRKDARLPEQLQRTMAAEAEAGRAARAKVITADGEMRSSRALAEASDIIEKSPAAIQLRYLQVRL